MVARVTTLKATADRLAGLVDYYAGLAEDRDRSGNGRGPVDYYIDAGEPPGRWWGRGLEALGLDGDVAGSELRALFVAEHPGDGSKLGRGFGEASARAFDVTFSAPKSVSILWAIHPDEAVRDAAAAAHDAAVTATLAWIEAHGAVTRRGAGGVDQVDAKGLTVAVFRQHTSRSSDPQLHSHAIVSAKVQDASGKWLSLDARWLKTQQRSISWVYDAALRAELTARIGVDWQPLAEGAGQSDVAGVGSKLLEVFSQRSAQVEAKTAELIERWADEHEGAEPSPREIAMLERRAVLASRPAKDWPEDGERLHEWWTGRARRHRYPIERLPGRALTDNPTALESASRAREQRAFVMVDAQGKGIGSLPASRDGSRFPDFVPDQPFSLDPSTGFARAEIVRDAITRASAEAATWLPTDLSRHIAALVPANAASSAETLVALVDELTDAAVLACVELAPPSPESEKRRRDGRPLGEAVTDHRLTSSEVWDQETELLAFAEDHAPQWLADGDPRAAAVHAAAGHERLVLIVGPAGAGKTTLLADAVRRLHADGREVVGFAPSGKAADVLGRDLGCPTMTLARLLANARPNWEETPKPNTTIIIDEAGMATTDDLARLAFLATALHWRIVAVGDPEQLPAVGRAGMFASWVDRHPAHRLDEIHRFTNPWEARASLLLRRGDPEAARIYTEHGRVHTIHPALLARRIAEQHANRAHRGETVAITATTEATARAVNLAIQRRRRPTGPSAALADGTRAYVGDEIATRRNDPHLRTSTGVSVRNRHTWTVTNVDGDGSITAEQPDRGSVRLPAHYVAHHVQLGWAVTGYGNQGTTVDHAIAIIETGTSRAGAYVALTRGRHSNTAWIVDPTGTLDPEEALATTIARPNTSLTAHDIADRLDPTAAGLGYEQPPDIAIPRDEPALPWL
ncbi:MAG TPA: MobF family relaxase [Acidimicrobiales bacterium]|nr:MobF family relaxase [Acidimicrobiales bacterium]